MRDRRCPYCDQVLPEFRLGVRFPNGVKARIFDLVQRGGVDGIPSDELHATVFDAHERKPAKKLLSVHVNQINELIEDSGYRISGRGGAYRLLKQRVAS
jgi:hypothetical protein